VLVRHFLSFFALCVAPFEDYMLSMAFSISLASARTSFFNSCHSWLTLLPGLIYLPALCDSLAYSNVLPSR
jgi:hypothetical protein